jgi:hypothetical protein
MVSVADLRFLSHLALTWRIVKAFDPWKFLPLWHDILFLAGAAGSGLWTLASRRSCALVAVTLQA